jgi:hypothetical protein
LRGDGYEPSFKTIILILPYYNERKLFVQEGAEPNITVNKVVTPHGKY